MTWTNRYHPPESNRWQGRADSPARSSFFQIIEMLDLRQHIPPAQDKLAFALIGFCCDEGIRRNLGREGAAEGPGAIRAVLAKLPVQKQNFTCFDAGDITCDDGDLESAQSALADTIHLLLQAGITPIILGGGHELAFGHYLGIAKSYRDELLGIVNFDAHFDMRSLLTSGKGSSGTPFLQIANAEHQDKRRFDYNCIGIQHAGNTKHLFDTAKKHNVQVILADDLHQGFMDKCVNFVDRVIDQNQLIYLTLCLDVLSAADAPGVSAPQAMGVTPWQILPLIRQLAASGKVISYDIAEMSPRYDIDNRTAKVAANFVYEIIHHHAKYTGTKHANHSTS